MNDDDYCPDYPPGLDLEQLSLQGDLDAARALAYFERDMSFTTNLDACPEAAEAYEIERARHQS